MNVVPLHSAPLASRSIAYGRHGQVQVFQGCKEAWESAREFAERIMSYEPRELFLVIESDGSVQLARVKQQQQQPEAPALSAEDVLDTARDAAAEAAMAYLREHGDHADCGSAWVIVPARSPIAKAVKQAGYGWHKHHAGGVALTLCGGLRVQSRIIYEKACHAFIEVLERHGYDARIYSYAD